MRSTFTIIIPVHNEEAIIQDCLLSILHQTSSPEEVMVVNNRSSDNTVQRVEAMRDQFDTKEIKLTVLDCPEGNQATARERGTALAQSDLIGFIDADTRLPTHWVEHARRKFENDEQLVALAGPMIYDRWYITVANALMYAYVQLRKSRYFFYGCNGVFRKQAYEQSGGLKGCYEFMQQHGHQEPYDDLYLSQRLRNVGKVTGSIRLYAYATFRVHGRVQGLMQNYNRWRKQGKETARIMNHVTS